jgi:hypothetical protein
MMMSAVMFSVRLAGCVARIEKMRENMMSMRSQIGDQSSEIYW